MRFEYVVRTTDPFSRPQTYTRKREAMQAASGLLAMGKTVTINRCRVYYSATTYHYASAFAAPVEQA